ncbi:MAG: hypothetical protein IKB51_07355 [Clostridia bacterium]|nr:hypothetical protein [Clostridia bacterium]
MPEKEIQRIRAEAINEFADRLINYYEHLRGRTGAMMVTFQVNEIRRELIEKGVKGDE